MELSPGTAEPAPVDLKADDHRPAPLPAPAPVAPARPVSPPTQAQTFIYALGQLDLRFPSLGVEKELIQATGRTETARLSDRQATQAVLRSNPYLARQLSWVLTIGGLETYVVSPRYATDLDLLLESMRPTPRATDIDVIIGVRGPVAPPQACGGLMLPVVIFDQLYSFDVDALVKAIPKPEGVAAKDFQPTAEELFSRIMLMADNAGATDQHRALNYLAVRYSTIYTQTADMHGRNFSLTAVDVRPSPLSGPRKVVDVVFTFTDRQTDVPEQYSVRVDVTEEFPFLVRKLSPFYEH
jgi:hypothetical protein